VVRTCYSICRSAWLTAVLLARFSEAPDGVVATFVVTIGEQNAADENTEKTALPGLLIPTTRARSRWHFPRQPDYIAKALPEGNSASSGKVEHFDRHVADEPSDIIAPVSQLRRCKSLSRSIR